MPRFDVRRDGPATLVILAIVAVALAILNFRLNRAQLQTQVVNAQYELNALQQAMSAYALEFPQASMLDIILKGKHGAPGYVHQGYLVRSSKEAVQLLPKDALQNYVYPLPKPQMPLQQMGSHYPYELLYGVISLEGRQWRQSVSENDEPPQCTSLGGHNLAESSFHLRFEWPDMIVRDENEHPVGFSPGPFVDYSDVGNFVEFNPTNGLNSHGYLIVR